MRPGRPAAFPLTVHIQGSMEPAEGDQVRMARDAAERMLEVLQGMVAGTAQSVTRV